MKKLNLRGFSIRNSILGLEIKQMNKISKKYRISNKIVSNLVVNFPENTGFRQKFQ